MSRRSSASESVSEPSPITLTVHFAAVISAKSALYSPGSSASAASANKITCRWPTSASRSIDHAALRPV